MLSLWQSLTHLFEPPRELPMPKDSTVYTIETTLGSYCGQILFQDDMQLKLFRANSKPVKILKSNIRSIVQVRTEVA